MNSMKTLFVMAVLGAVAYGVYVTITRDSERTAQRQEATAWPGAAIPDTAVAMPQFPGQPGAPVTYPQNPSAPASSPGMPAAPPFSTPQPVAGPGAAEMAIPYPSKGYPGPASVPSQSPGTGIANPPPLAAAAPYGQAFRGAPSGTNLAGPAAGNRYADAIEVARKQLDQGRLAEGHLTLSKMYGDPEMPSAEARQLTELLDQVAGTVIYSPQHLLEPAHKVASGETLDRIALRYNVPWQLLAAINGVADPNNLTPGSELKVVRGPFEAIIELDKYELTLILDGRYAGRFPVGIGLDYRDLAGSYVVCTKTAAPQYYGPDGQHIAAGAADNPYGAYWLGLGERTGADCRIGIHGTSDPNNLHRTAGRGSIRLGDQDIQDIFGILSIGSRVVIRGRGNATQNATRYPATVDRRGGIR